MTSFLWSKVSFPDRSNFNLGKSKTSHVGYSGECGVCSLVLNRNSNKSVIAIEDLWGGIVLMKKDFLLVEIGSHNS